MFGLLMKLCRVTYWRSAFVHFVFIHMQCSEKLQREKKLPWLKSVVIKHCRCFSFNWQQDFWRSFMSHLTAHMVKVIWAKSTWFYDRIWHPICNTLLMLKTPFCKTLLILFLYSFILLKQLHSLWLIHFSEWLSSLKMRIVKIWLMRHTTGFNQEKGKIMLTIIINFSLVNALSGSGSWWVWR